MCPLFTNQARFKKQQLSDTLNDIHGRVPPEDGKRMFAYNYILALVRYIVGIYKWNLGVRERWRTTLQEEGSA